MDLDAKDREILFELSLNGRMSLTDLAGRVELSKQVVSNRIRCMREQGVIKKFYAVTNIYGLGKAHYRVFIKYQNMNPRVETQLRQCLMGYREVAWVIGLSGAFDIFFVVWTDNIIGFEKIFDEIMGRFGRYFQEKYFSVATRIEYLPYHFLTDRRKHRREESYLLGGEFGSCKPDKMGRKILTLLNTDGRIYSARLARELGVSVRAARRKVDELMEKRVILGFNLKIDHRLLGFTYRKVLLKLNDTSATEIERLSGYLKGKDPVVYLLKTIGTFDFEFELMTRTDGQYYDMIKDLRMELGYNIEDHDMVVMGEAPKYESLVL